MFILFLVRFGLLSGLLLGNSCSLSWLTICSLSTLTICKFSFGFEGWIWVLTASVPDLCILFFNSLTYRTSRGYIYSAFYIKIL